MECFSGTLRNFPELAVLLLLGVGALIGSGLWVSLPPR